MAALLLDKIHLRHKYVLMDLCLDMRIYPQTLIMFYVENANEIFKGTESLKKHGHSYRQINLTAGHKLVAISFFGHFFRDC